jgi:hypothetical protein
MPAGRRSFRSATEHCLPLSFLRGGANVWSIGIGSMVIGSLVFFFFYDVVCMGISSRLGDEGESCAIYLCAGPVYCAEKGGWD